MARVPLIGEERSDLAPFIARVKAERGKLINLYRVLMNSPAIAAGWLDFNTVVRYKTSLDAALREMIILRVSLLNGAEYQAKIHGASHALKAGLSAEQIAALNNWQDSSLFSPAERAALAWTDAMTVLAGAYNMHTRVARALRIEPEQKS